MTQEDFDDFVEEVEDTVSEYINDDAWWTEEEYFGDDYAYVTICYDLDEFDWDEVDDDWQSDLDDDLSEVGNDWGAALDWQDGSITLRFNF